MPLFISSCKSFNWKSSTLCNVSLSSIRSDENYKYMMRTLADDNDDENKFIGMRLHQYAQSICLHELFEKLHYWTII